MDIPDIELVILYGAPSGVNQLHQVVSYTVTIYMYVQLYFVD